MTTDEEARGKASEEVAQWLQDAARRRMISERKESDQALLGYLEQLSGRQINSRGDIRAYVEGIAEEAKRKSQKRQQLKNMALGVLFVIAALQYHYLDVQLQILSQPTLTVFYPTKPFAAHPPS
jgi:hypothetical protein